MKQGRKAARQKNKGGLFLRTRQGAGGRGRLLHTLLALLLGAALNFCLFGTLGLSLPVPLAAGAAVCLLYALLLWRGKEAFFLPALLSGLLLLSLAAMGPVSDGACLTWNRFTELWVAATGRLLPELAVKGGREGLSLALFSGLTGAMLGLLSLGLTIRFRTAAAAIPLLWWLGLSLLLHQASLPAMGLCLLSAFGLLLSAGWQGEEGLRALLLTGTASAALFALLLTAAMSPGLRRWGETVAENCRERVHAMRYETKHSYLPEGDFRNFKNKNGEGYTALAVTMEAPERLFLRGFVGENFEEQQWKPSEGSVLAENRQRLGWLQGEGAFSQTGFAAAAAGLELESASVTVQNLNGCSAYLYLPYTLKEDSLSLLEKDRLSPDGAKAPGLQGQRSYTYEIYSGGPEYTASVLDALQSAGEDARQREALWQSYVKETSLGVPESFTELLGPVLADCARPYGGMDQLSYGQAQQAALAVLERCFGENADVAELPLPQAAGTQYQYSTVAVLTLRSFGIPARYAEGYEITKSMAEEAKGGSIVVDSSCGRAWVEVYQQGMGWMPMEQTPGFEALVGKQNHNGVSPVGYEGVDPNAPVGSTQGEGGGVPLTEGREQDSDNAEKDDTDGFLQGGGAMVRIRQLIRWTLLLLASGICLLPVLVVLRHWWCIRKKRRCFYQSDCREAVSWIYADAARMLKYMGLDRRGGSMEPVCAEAEAISADFGNMCRAMTALNGLALFSDHPVSPEQRREMLLFRSETLGWLKQRVRWYRRLWLRWGLCLY